MGFSEYVFVSSLQILIRRLNMPLKTKFYYFYKMFIKNDLGFYVL